MNVDFLTTVVPLISFVFGYFANEFLRGLTGNSVERWAISILQFFKRRRRISQDTDYFQVGAYRTSLFLFDGDGDQEYSQLTLSLQYADYKPECPDDIAKKTLIEQNLLEDAHAKGIAKAWDGIGVGLVSYDIFRNYDESRIGASIRCCPSRYSEFRATVAKIGTEERGKGTSIYEKYLKGNNLFEIVPFLAKHVGVAVLVVTKDNFMIMARRSQNVGARAGEIDVSVVEGINPAKDCDPARATPTIDVFKAIQRGCREELGIDPAHEEIKLLGFGVDMRFYQFNFVAIVYSRMTRDEVFSKRNGRALDAWESTLFALELHPKEIEVVQKEAMWGFSSVLVYWALCRHYTPRIVDAQAGQLVIRRDGYEP